jgi:hypothetical protein
MAALSVADGVVYGQCQARKRFVDFRSFLETAIVTKALERGVRDPWQWYWITGRPMLPSSSHAGSRSWRPSWRGNSRSSSIGCLSMPAFLDQLEIWFSLLHRKLLQPNHFCSLNELKLAIGDFIVRYNQTAKPLKWS